jgi:hypothetical protein
MELQRFLKTKEGNIFMSVILGFGLATCFREVCKGQHCYKFVAPPMEDIKEKVFKYDGKCFKYTANQTKCDKTKRIVPLN